MAWPPQEEESESKNHGFEVEMILHDAGAAESYLRFQRCYGPLQLAWLL